MNNILAFFAIAILLSACGGSSSESDTPVDKQKKDTTNKKEKAKPAAEKKEKPQADNLTLDARHVHYAAIKLGDGKWKKLSQKIHKIESTTPDQDLTVYITAACIKGESNNKYHFRTTIINLNKNMSLSLWKSCNASKVFPSFSYSGVSGYSLTVSNSVSVKGQSVTLTSGEGPRSVAAIENKRFFSKKNIDFRKTKLNPDFNDTDSVELQPFTDFDVRVQYRLPGSASGIGVSEGNKNTTARSIYIIPEEKRVAGDFYKITKEVRSQYYYQHNIKNISDNMSLPDLSALAIYKDQLVLSNDKKTITVNIPQILDLKYKDLAPAEIIMASYTRSESVGMVYSVDIDVLKNNSVSINIVDPTQLPGFAPQIDEIPLAKLIDGWDLELRNTTAPGKPGHTSVTLISRDR